MTNSDLRDTYLLIKVPLLTLIFFCLEDFDNT